MSSSPLLAHRLDAPSAFRPEALLDAVRGSRGLAADAIPPLCVLDFDGDLSDGLIRDGRVSRVSSWPCFHTEMLGLTLDGLWCGVIPRTIGGPYAVLIAEQLLAAGAEVIVGITSAGRVSPALPLPSIVVADRAIRDEGTSLHYLPADETVDTPTPGLAEHLARALEGIGAVRRGLVWTTDAPYRETHDQLRRWAEAGALAVEMQAASLFAFARARGAHVGVVALVSNSVDHTGDQFDTGEHAYRLRVLSAIAVATHAHLAARNGTGVAPPRMPLVPAMDRYAHWNSVYETRQARDASWYEEVPTASLRMLDAAGLTSASCVLDVGGGDSRLVDQLVARGVLCVAVLDVSSAALLRARARLGDAASVPVWIEADVTGTWWVDPVDVWHDRAVFHFLTEPEDRARYRAHLERVLKPGGFAIIATFALDGPEKCSGLPVARYSPQTLQEELGEGFELIDSVSWAHSTPSGDIQSFQYSRFRHTH